MISSKYINLIIIGVLLVAIIFTGMLTFFPNSIGIETKSSQPDYASKLFNKDSIISIDIKADEKDWASMLENATQEEYISCDVTINGTTFKSVGIRPKGNSSLSTVASSDSDRFSFKFEFDHYIEGQTCYGLDKLVINNVQADATYMKDYLSYDLMTYMGVATPLYSYTNVTVNGDSWGFYLAVEALEESFAQRNYGSDYGMLYKPESMGARGNGVMKDFENNDADDQATDKGNQAAKPNTNNNTAATGNLAGGMKNGFGGGGSGGGTDLIYTDEALSSYSNIFDYEVFEGDESDYEKVIEALKNLNNGTNLEKYINVDETLRYFAVNTVLVNLDSYFSNMKHNYYLYEENGQLSMLPWDYNLAFGGFQSGTASSAVNFPIDTPVSGVELSERPILAKLLEVDEYKEKYHEYLQDIVDGYFNKGTFEAAIIKVDTLISEYVKNDVSAFYTYDKYFEAVAMIKEFGKLRAQSIQGQLNGTIPATTDGQTKAADKLIDASSVNLSIMGAQGGGGGGRGGGMGNENGQQQNGGQQPVGMQPSDGMQSPDGMQLPGDGNMQQPVNMPDREISMKAMQIIQAANGNNLTEEQLAQLKKLGLTDEQITSMKSMASQFGNRGTQQGGGLPGNGDPRQNGMGQQNNQVATTEGLTSSTNLPVIAVSLGCLVVGLIFVVKFRRRKYL